MSVIIRHDGHEATFRNTLQILGVQFNETKVRVRGELRHQFITGLTRLEAEAAVDMADGA